MDSTALGAAVQHTRNACQALWDARTKGDVTAEEAAFAEPAQYALERALDLLEETRSLLSTLTR